MTLINHLHFRMSLGGKMGATTTLAPTGLGAQNTNKQLAHWIDLFFVVVVKPSVGLAICRNNILYNDKNPRRALTNMRHCDTLNTY